MWHARAAMNASRRFSGGPDSKSCGGGGRYHVDSRCRCLPGPSRRRRRLDVAWKQPGTLKGAVLKPAPAGVHVPATYPREPAGQGSDHLPASPMTAAPWLRLNHHATAPGKAQAREFRRDPAAGL